MKYLLKESVETYGLIYNFVYDIKNERFLILDPGLKKIHIIKYIDDSMKKTDTFELEPDLYDATAIAVNKNGNVFLACPTTDRLVVLNDRFKREKEFKEINMHDVNYLRLNENDCELFMQSNLVNVIKMFNTDTGQLIKEFPFEYSWHLSVKNCKLYVMFKDSVFIYDTNTTNLLTILTYDDWKGLKVLYVDDESSLYVLTTDEDTPFISYVYIFDKDLKFSRKILVDYNFNELYRISDMMVIGKELFISAEDSNDLFSLHRFTLLT